MRIAHLIHQFPPETHGGAERHCEQLARAQASRHEVFVYSQSARHEGTEPISKTFGRLTLRRWRDRLPSAQGRLAKDLDDSFREFAPDVVHVHHGIGFPPESLLGLARNYPCVVTLHDYWWMCPRITLLYHGATPCPGPAPLSRCARCYKDDPVDAPVGEAAALASLGLGGRLFRNKRSHLAVADAEFLRHRAAKRFASSAWLRRWYSFRRRAVHKGFLRDCRAWISPSAYLLTRYEAAGYLAPRTGDAIPYGVETTARIARESARRPVRFVFLGGTAPHKGFDLVRRGFAEIAPEDATLDIYGGLSPAAPLPVCARWRGFVPPDRHAEFWREADVLLAPSIWVENAPKVVSEALAWGVPVIAADHGALPEMIGPGRGGLLFTGQDSLSLKNLIGQLIADPGIIDRERALIPVPTSIESVAEAVDDVYRRVL